jgi:hypothetical protein
VTLPRRDARRGIVTDDREQLGVRVLARHGSEGVGGVARTAHVDLRAAGDETVDVRDRRLDHRQPVERRRDHARSVLLPGQVRHHQHDEIEAERVANVDSSDEMTDMRWVEGTPEQPNSQARRGCGHGGRV